jgi:hypothetical protein
MPFESWDLRQAAYEAWERFVFGHPAEPEAELNAWYFTRQHDPIIEPARQIEFLTRLFRRAGELPTRYSAAQLEQGFWLVFAAAAEHFVGLVWDRTVPWEARRTCLAAVYDLYAGLFAEHPLEDADYMIPDLLADGYSSGRLDPARDPEAARVQVVLLDVFRRMLALPAAHCQEAALHGLGHLAHPGGPAVIRAYLDAHPSLPSVMRTYAECAMAGAVL